MSEPIPVDFNRLNAEDNLVAARRRIPADPEIGSVVDVVDDEDNRALARVLRLEGHAVILEPIWETFASAAESRIVPAAETSRFLLTWASATSVSVGVPAHARQWVTLKNTGRPDPTRVPV